MWYLAGEAGIRQLLDIGTGLPTAGNTREVAQQVAPSSRIVHVDNDPLVLAHARALLTSSREGATDYIDTDVCDPRKILQGGGRDAGLLRAGCLDAARHPRQRRGHRRRPARSSNRLVDAVPSGSYLVINDGTDTIAAGVEGAEARGEAGDPYYLRSPDVIARFFDGLELVEPGVVSPPRWWPATGTTDEQAELAVFCGMAGKPRA